MKSKSIIALGLVISQTSWSLIDLGLVRSQNSFR